MTQPSSQVPKMLLDQLHRANQRLHEAKEELEQNMDGSNYRHEERVDVAMQSFREAERAVEDIERQISAKLHEKT